MKGKFNLTKQLSLLCVLIVLVIVSCKQEEIKPETQIENDARIEALKDYFGDVTGFDAKSISYDAVMKMFYTPKGDRISEEELENFYKNNGPVNHYKDGVPVPRN